jgi:hypothetical protein
MCDTIPQKNSKYPLDKVVKMWYNECRESGRVPPLLPPLLKNFSKKLQNTP